MEKEQCYAGLRKAIAALYRNASPAPNDIDDLAKTLTELVTDESEDLADVAPAVGAFEKNLKDLDSPKFFYVLAEVVDRVPVDRIGAKKLYDLFTNNLEDLGAASRLLNEYKDYLTQEQYASVKEKARGLFDVGPLFSNNDWYDDDDDDDDV